MDLANQTALPTRVPPRSVSVTVITLATVFVLLGMFGNSRVLVQLYRRRHLRKVPHYLFASLSLTGVLAMSFSLTSFVIFSTVYYLLDDGFSIDLVCKIGKPVSLTVGVLNALTLSAMAIDREDRVLRPLQLRMTPNNIKKVIFVIWMVATFLTVISFVMISQENFTCTTNNPYISHTTNPNMATMLFIVHIGTIVNVAAFLTIIITFFRVLKKLRLSTLPQANTSQQSMERQITKSTSKLCTVFLITWLPIITINVVARTIQFDANTIGNLRLFTLVMSHFNYALNPFLHFKMLRARRHRNLTHAETQTVRTVNSN